ncbi:3'-5' exonuclease, partial [Peptoniphilus sp.]|uniref:3'-5' exonuclease n=1 Tax=Peptoniphilus sp. TaxID=1971214 RepID=UPI003D90AD0B
KQEFDDLEVGVNVLTIHKSKGLEFDAVIIANMDKSNLISNKNKIVVDKEVGLGIKSNFSTANFDRANRNLRDIDSEEEKRILYVAMTRAKKELVLFGNYEKSRPASFFSIIKDSGVEVCEYTFKREKLKSQDETQHELFNFNKETEFRIREYYTVSDFLNFRRSPEEFYKKYFLGIDDYTNGNSEEKIMDPKLLGEIVHYFAKTNNKNDTSNSDIDLYIERIFNYYEEELNEDKFNLVKNLCLNYLSMEENDVLYKELLFYYNLDGYLVKGYIDAVIKIDDKYYIVDYKTNDADEEYLLKTYKPQVLIYSKIFESLYNIKINGAYIYDLRGSNKLKVETHDSEIASIMKEFSEFIDFTRKHIVYKDYIL